MKFRDYYSVLGVERNASADEIQKAFRKLAREFHPDVNRSKEAEERFKEINEAYEVLKDPEKRKRYDMLGASYKEGQDFRPPPGWEGQAGGNFKFDFSNMQGEGLEGFSDFFEALFGGAAFGGGHARGRSFGEGQAFQGRSPFGEDAGAFGREPARREAELEIGIEEGLLGASKTIEVSDGRGSQASKTLKVKIPAGTGDGAKIRLAGGSDGDLILKIKFRPHPRFAASGDDLVVRLPIAPWEAVLGARVDVALPDGNIKLTVPQGAQTGARLRVKNRGFKRKGSSGRGDVIVELKIVVPTTLSDKEREMFETLAAVSKFNPRVAA